MNRIGKAVLNLLLIAAFILTMCFGAYAAEAPVVVGLFTDKNGAGLFLHGDLPDEWSAKVSGQDCEVSVSNLAQPQTKIRTLFVIDISTSMRQGSRKQVQDMLTGLIEDKAGNEQYAIAAFGGEYTLLSDFTDDRYDLVKAVEKLEWNRQASSIYRAVDSAVESIREKQTDELTFTQIILFSDGVEKAEDGIIKEELFFHLKEFPLPLHTIGFRYENNAEGLKELYALSRMTGGFSYGLAANADVSEAAGQIAGYISGVKYIQIRLPEQIKDGAVRPLEFYDSASSRILRHDLHTPVTEQASPAPTSEPEPQPEPVPEPKPVEEPKPAISLWLIILPAIGAVALAIVIVILVRKKKKPEPEINSGENFNDKTELAVVDDDATMFLIADRNRQSQGQGYYLILNDLEQPHKRFEILVENKVEIGRIPNQPGITIDYDKRISRRHFVVVKRDGGLWIEDIGSVNKTCVNDETVTAPKALRDNDVISCGKTRLAVKIERR